MIVEFDLRMDAVSSDQNERLRIQADIQKDFINTALQNDVKVIIHFGAIDNLNWMEDPERGGSTADPTSFWDDGSRKPNYYAEMAAFLDFLKYQQSE